MTWPLAEAAHYFCWPMKSCDKGHVKRAKRKHSTLLKSHVWSIITFLQKSQYIILIFEDGKNAGMVAANISPFILLDSWLSVKILRPLSFGSDKTAFIFPLLHERKPFTFHFSFCCFATFVCCFWNSGTNPETLVACDWWHARSWAVEGEHKAQEQKKQRSEKGREPWGPQPPRFQSPLWFLELLLLGF